MASKILLLNVSPDACLLEHEHAAQKFIVAANTVFLKAQGLAMLVPLHKMAFGLLEGLLDNWCLLNLMTIEWLHKAEVHQACVNIWSLNKQVPWAAEFGKTVVAPQPIVNPAPTPVSTTSLIQCTPSVPYIADPSSLPMHSCHYKSRKKFVPPPQNKGKGTAKVIEDDNDNEEATQKLRKELEDFMVPTTFDDKLLASLLPPPSEYFKGDSRLPRGTKILGGRKGDITLVSPATCN
ncbi:hypothetical protein C0995_014088 [Termitomyces sp. Mi166|nr:hypothetical protein C0995_014088 [Termitomyces sp. Mi166\